MWEVQLYLFSMEIYFLSSIPSHHHVQITKRKRKPILLFHLRCFSSAAWYSQCTCCFIHLLRERARSSILQLTPQTATRARTWPRNFIQVSHVAGAHDTELFRLQWQGAELEVKQKVCFDCLFNKIRIKSLKSIHQLG